MTTKDLKTLDIKRIMEMLPHRYPFLLVDRVIDLVPGESATGIKNVTMNEPHFMGHFPGLPVMPGVLIIEAMAQTAALVVVEAMGGSTRDKVVFFMSIDNARFRKPIVPGDTVRIHVKKLQSRASVWKFEGQAMVDGKLCAEATYSAMIADKQEE
ncbi:MAG: 3-hydroxyacyl-ACP dehydratase FabZ [Alphaproteobacteria bacterium]